MKCVIYTRVSSNRQVIEGNGLQSQEQRCRQHAKSQGWRVDKVFIDSAVSGSLLERPGIQDLICYLTTNKEEVIVLADNISRIARNTLVFRDGGKKALESRVYKFKTVLRGYLYCNTCEHVMYTDRSGGRSSRYQYHVCKQSECPHCNKHIRTLIVENQFISFLKDIEPKPSDIDKFLEGLQTITNSQEGALIKARERCLEKVAECDKDINQGLTDMEALSSPRVIELVEKKIIDIEGQKQVHQKEYEQLFTKRISYEDDILPKVEIFRNLTEKWQKACYTRRVELQVQYIPHGVSYNQMGTFRNRDTPLLLWAIHEFSRSNYSMVRR